MAYGYEVCSEVEVMVDIVSGLWMRECKVDSACQVVLAALMKRLKECLYLPAPEVEFAREKTNRNRCFLGSSKARADL